MLVTRLPRAEDCLRCRLRQALYQASRSGRHFQGGALQYELQRRHETTQAVASDLHDQQQTIQVQRQHVRGGAVVYKIIPNQGKTRRIRGTTKREDRKQLGIKSLGQESEVIVLRDVSEGTNVRPAFRSITFQGTADSAQSMTAEEIEALFQKQKPAKRDEIEKAIDDLKPQVGVITRQEFEKGLRALTKGFKKSQLQNYLRLHISPDLLRLRTANSDVGTQEQQGIQSLKRTTWHSGTTNVNRPLPGVNRAARRQASNYIAAGGPKQNVAADIYRLAWGVEVEEEAATKGQIDLLLTPDQWGLLQTRDATDLFTVFRSRRFYQNSRFERSKERNTIRIIGPKAEAENIAQNFQSAFALAQTQLIDLGPLNTGPHVKSGSLSDVFTASQLKAIMNLAKVHIVFDEEASKISVHGFGRDQVDSAVRLLMALVLPLSTQETQTISQPRHDVGLAPMFVGKTLPSAMRSLPFGRRTTNVSLGSERISLQPSGLSTNVSDLSERDPASPNQTRPVPGTPDASDDALAQSLIKELLSRMRQVDVESLPQIEAEENSYWPSSTVDASWQASTGFVLHQIETPVTPVPKEAQPVDLSDSVWSLESPTSAALSSLQAKMDVPTVFSSQAPGLHKVLSFFQSPSGRRHPPFSQLIAHLVPSPLSAVNPYDVYNLPRISIVFNLERVLNRGQLDESPATGSRNSWRFPIDNSAAANLIGINMDISRHEFNVELPDRSVDLRLSRSSTLRASLQKAMDDPDIQTFVMTVVESLRSDGEIKAPQTLDIKLPFWLTKDRGTDAPDKTRYLFTGFEHRSRQRWKAGPQIDRLAPGITNDYQLAINIVEAGFSRGRRTDVQLRKAPRSRGSGLGKDKDVSKPDAGEPQRLVKAALALVKLLDEVGNGTLKPAMYRTTSAGTSRPVLTSKRHLIKRITRNTD